MLTRDEARALVDRIFKLTRTPEVAVSLAWRQNCNTRFANNHITTAGFTTDFNISIEVTEEHRSGAASTSETTEASLRDAVRRAEELAALSPPDPEYVEPLGPQTYPEIAAFDQVSAEARAAQLLPGVKAAIEAAEAKKVRSFGFFEVDAGADAIANKNGLFGYHRRTWAGYSATVRTPDGTGSGWAESQAPRLAQVNAGHVATTALRKALDSQKPRQLEPGKYTVILEPAALDEMLGFLAFSFSARAADEGRSFLSRRGGGNLLGEKIFGENISFRSDPFDARVPGRPWSGGGGGFFFGGGGAAWLPAEKTTWVEQGVVKNLAYDRYWAKKNEKKATPFPSNVILEGGTASLDDLIASTERGLLITRFWYIRFLQPQTVQLTGLTRDGLFYIEGGKIQYPVMNFRFNQSVVEMLNQVEALTPAAPVGTNLLPTVKVRDFNFSSLSDAI